MKNKIIILIILLFPTMLYSQVKISGQIRDKENNLIDYIEVLLQNKDSVYIKSELTNADGKFTFEADKGEYTVIVRQMGTIYHNQKIDLKEDIDLGVIQINKKQLSEVVISGQKKIIERKVDRLVFNVENSIASTGGTALDALKTTPSVQVNIEDIILVGRGGVRVMVNDRMIELSGENLNNYLQTISSDDIKRIEVITTPPAKYEAEGNNGLINIVLKKGVLNSWNNTIRSTYRQSINSSYSLGNTFNFNKNKWAISVSVDGEKGSQSNILDYQIFFPNAKNISQLDNKKRTDYFSANLGVDYDISKKSSFGGILRISESYPDNKDNQYIDIFDDNNLQYSKILSNGNSIEQDKNISTNLHFIQKLDTLGRVLSLDLDYFNYHEDKDRIFTSNLYNQDTLSDFIKANNTGNQNIDNYSINLDMQHPFKWANLNYGGKLSFSNTKSAVKYSDISIGNPIIDSLQSDDFEYREDVQALFIEIAQNLSRKLKAKFGLRYEHTYAKGLSLSYNEEFTNNYGKLFPTAYVLYFIDKNNFINLNYSRRISRPGFWELNPFRWYINSNSYAEGNPFLNPSYNHNFEITHGYKQKLFSTVILQKTEDNFGQVPSVIANNNQQLYLRKNYSDIYNIGLVENFRFSPFKWWMSNNQFYLLYSITEIKNEFKNYLQSQNGFYSSISTNNSFVLNKKRTFLGEMNFRYTFPSISGIYNISESFSLDLALKYLFLDKNLVASFSVNDILKTSNPDITTFTNNTKQIYNNYYDSRYFKISLSYTFGNKKIQVQKQIFGNEEEQKRTK